MPAMTREEQLKAEIGALRLAARFCRDALHFANAQHDLIARARACEGSDPQRSLNMLRIAAGDLGIPLIGQRCRLAAGTIRYLQIVMVGGRGWRYDLVEKRWVRRKAQSAGRRAQSAGGV